MRATVPAILASLALGTTGLRTQGGGAALVRIPLRARHADSKIQESAIQAWSVGRVPRRHFALSDALKSEDSGPLPRYLSSLQTLGEVDWPEVPGDDPYSGLVEIKIKDPFAGRASFAMVPKEWERRLVPGSALVHSVGWIDDTFSARLVSEKKMKVLFRITDAECGTTLREAGLMDRMCGSFAEGGSPASALCSGHVLAYFDFRVVGSLAFTLTQGFEATLQTLLEMADYENYPYRQMELVMHVPLEKSLPIIIDVLRGLCDMERAGMVHAALTPGNIALLYDDAEDDRPPRALLSGIEGSCVATAEDAIIGCASLADDDMEFYVTSPYHQPPEVADGSPIGMKDHPWSAGLIFATMCLGYNPVTELVIRMKPKADGWELHPRGRKAIRDLISEHFTIEQDPRFQFLDPDVHRLLEGMLAKDPAKRLSTGEALFEAMSVAALRGITVPAPLKPARLPAEWWLPHPEDEAGGAGTPAELMEHFWASFPELGAPGLPVDELALGDSPGVADAMSEPGRPPTKPKPKP